jgi:hypothetical protein
MTDPTNIGAVWAESHRRREEHLRLAYGLSPEKAQEIIQIVDNMWGPEVSDDFIMRVIGDVKARGKAEEAK